MSTATLRGADHTEIGEIGSISEGRAAIAISRGGAGKTYAYRDPNEDVAAFALSNWGAVAIVADGHAGCMAAQVAVNQVLEAHAPRWLEPAPIALEARFASEAVEVAADVNVAILKATTGSETGGSRTTLTIGLLRPGDGWVAALSVGDSHAFLTGEGGTLELAAHPGDRSVYLGDASLSRGEIELGVRVQRVSCVNHRALVLATDGLSEAQIGVSDPADAVRQAVLESENAPQQLQPREAARNVLRQALTAHRANRSGDNAAAAVLWLP